MHFPSKICKQKKIFLGVIMAVILYFSREVLCNWDKILVYFSVLPKFLWLLGPHDCRNSSSYSSL